MGPLPALRLERLDHIGIAVADLPAALALYRDLLGLVVTHDERVEGQETRVLFLSAPSGADLELLVPLDDESPVGRFLTKRGPGMHHLCYVVPDLEAAIGTCLAGGLQMIDESPRTGAKGKRLAFVHPRAAGGVLIELCELPAAPTNESPDSDRVDYT